jgi:transposase
MFVRRKKNRSGSVSVVVAEKSGGRFRELKTVGISSDSEEIKKLVQEGKLWIHKFKMQHDLFAGQEKERQNIAERDNAALLLDNVENVMLNGTELILNRVYQMIGFDRINDDTLRQLVIARLINPVSKLATVDYLKSHFDEDVNLTKIYRYMDKLHKTHQAMVHGISVEHTRRVLGGRIGLVFYDVTTLYFETDYSDELREKGYSKDGKHANPQVVPGLLVSRGGYPLAYSLFNGAQYEGYTMIPVVEDFVTRFKLKDFVVVADSGLMNSKNIALLESAGYKYIIGAKIKSETTEVKQWIMSLEKQDGCFHELGKLPRSRLIVGYSDNRAGKDAYNRQKGVKRLVKAFQSGSLTKENINRRGYNKFLDISGNVKVSINADKIADDARWDGWKGYMTNTDFAATDVYEQYHDLWFIERAYRITKGTLEMRPIFHFTPRRIEAHVCICFVAYKVYKELERLLKAGGINLSVDKVIEIARTITTIRVRLPQAGQTLTRTMLLTPQHRLLAPLFNPQSDFWVTQ